jgi:hypothetical protein
MSFIIPQYIELTEEEEEMLGEAALEYGRKRAARNARRRARYAEKKAGAKARATELVGVGTIVGRRFSGMVE